MHAATVEVLINKAHLEPDVAVAFAEAVDMAIFNAQLVTVPVLDNRFAALQANVDSRFATFQANVDSRFAAFEAKVDSRFAAFEAKVDVRFAAVDARFVALEAKMDARFETFEARMNAGFAEVDAKIEKRTADLVRWVLLVMLSNVALSAGATAVLNFLQRGH